MEEIDPELVAVQGRDKREREAEVTEGQGLIEGLIVEAAADHVDEHQVMTMIETKKVTSRKNQTGKVVVDRKVQQHQIEELDQRAKSQRKRSTATTAKKSPQR